jgi:hypothetical protein
MKIDWTLIKNADVYTFAHGLTSGRSLYRLYVNTEAGGQVRNLVRQGVERARVLAKKTLRRRMLKGSFTLTDV